MAPVGDQWPIHLWLDLSNDGGGNGGGTVNARMLVCEGGGGGRPFLHGDELFHVGT